MKKISFILFLVVLCCTLFGCEVIIDKPQATTQNGAEGTISITPETVGATTPEETVVATDSYSPTTVPPTPAPTESATEPPKNMHTHSFAAATCTTPKTCSCGATEGNAIGHNWKNATCSAPKTCTTCGATSGSLADHSWTAATCTAPQKCKTCSAETGSAKGHNYSQGTCLVCGSKDPNHVAITYILNTYSMKFHKPSCWKLPTDNRKDTTMSRDEVIAAGYDACGICHP